LPFSPTSDERTRGTRLMRRAPLTFALNVRWANLQTPAWVGSGHQVTETEQFRSAPGFILSPDPPLQASGRMNDAFPKVCASRSDRGWSGRGLTRSCPIWPSQPRSCISHLLRPHLAVSPSVQCPLSAIVSRRSAISSVRNRV